MTQRYLPAPPAIRPLYEGGPDISPVAWGMWRFEGSDVAAAQHRVETALAAGITLFDTADIYGLGGPGGFGGAEALLGQVFAATPDLRARLVLASKGGIIPGVPYDSSPEYLSQALDASLGRLGVEHLDLWQIHRPDILTHPQETARALGDMVTSGKVGAVGVSNFTPAQISALSALLDIPLAVSQPEFSALCHQPITDGQLDRAMARGMHILAWSPLGGGRIADPQSAAEQAAAAALDAVAQEHGVSRAVAAFSWVAAHPAHPIPIIGSQTPERIAEAADIAKIRWTRESWYAVLQAAMGEDLP